jgi:hypothetical protein
LLLLKLAELPLLQRPVWLLVCYPSLNKNPARVPLFLRQPPHKDRSNKDNHRGGENIGTSTLVGSDDARRTALYP